RLDSAPPLSYLISHAFVVVFGPTPEALRIGPAILGALLVPVVAALTRRCAGDPAAVGAAIICALAPAPVVAGRDARRDAISPTVVAGTVAQFFAGPPIEPGTSGKLDIQALQVVAVVGGLAALGLLVAYRRLLNRAAAFLLLCGAVPIAILVTVSVWHPLLE